MTERATKAANLKSANEGLKFWFGAGSYLGAEAQYAAGYLPMVDELQTWVDAGYLTEGAADNLRIAAGKVDDGLEGLKAIGSSDDLDARKRLANAGQSLIRDALPDEVLDLFIVYHPETSFNMVRWVEVDMALVPDEWRKYVVDGIVRAPDSVVDELYRVGFDDAWIVARDYEDVVNDIAAVAYRAASSALKQVWEDNGGFSWLTRRDNPDYQLTDTWDKEKAGEVGALFDQLHVDIPDDWVNDDGSWTLSAGELKDVLTTARTRFKSEFVVSAETEQVLAASPSDGVQLLADMKDASTMFADMGYDSPLDAVSGDVWDGLWWVYVNGSLSDKTGEVLESTMHLGTELAGGGSPEQLRELFRQRHRDEIVINDQYTGAMYADDYERDWGPLNFQKPVPPPVAELEVAFTADRRNWAVVDGDTIELINDAGEIIPFRLLGVNAPDDGDEGYGEATEALTALLDRAVSVTVGMFNRAMYGDTQKFYSQTVDGVVDRERIFGFLYVDFGDGNGFVVVYDPSVFTDANVRGVPKGRTLDVPDYMAMYLRELGGSI